MVLKNPAGFPLGAGGRNCAGRSGRPTRWHSVYGHFRL